MLLFNVQAQLIQAMHVQIRKRLNVVLKNYIWLHKVWTVQRYNKLYFVASEDSPGELAAKRPGRRGYRRGSEDSSSAFSLNPLNATK